MLTPQEQINVRELLEVVPLTDLLSVASAVTNKVIKVKTKEEAVKAILLHESSYLSFLNRKKIKRNTLIYYLNDKDICCEATLDKESLVEKVINYWLNGSREVYLKNDKFFNESNATGEGSSPEQETNHARSPAATQSQSIELELAKQFTTWFYEKLNEDFLKKGGEVILECDFWPDCQAIIHLPDADSSSQNYTSSNAKETVYLIRSLRSQYDLYFSPNVNLDGVKGKTDPHGLVLIAVCGTIHSRAGACVGVFEQVFGLIADPMTDNNFKIKKTKLCLKNETNSQSLAILN